MIKLYQFVYWLRAIAAVMITNSHYADIWPISAMAFGGHFGNCIYFFLSGFCLYKIKDSFPKWYLKRIIRVYPAVWIASLINILPTFTRDDGIMAYVHCFLYPTRYHFVGSIMLLYILFYVYRQIQTKIKFNALWVVLALFAAYILVYIFAFDKSYYHIDDVNEKWCRFMFAASMLLGSYAREKYDSISAKIKPLNIIVFILFTAFYFAGKFILRGVPSASKFQFLMPIIVVIYIFNIAIIFIKIEKKGLFAKASRIISRPVKFISDISFEIYLVQFAVISRFSSLVFPLNFAVTTLIIIVYAFAAHKLAELIQKLIFKIPVFTNKKKEALK